jgi:outer membrane protein assembly factor BamB
MKSRVTNVGNIFFILTLTITIALICSGFGIITAQDTLNKDEMQFQDENTQQSSDFKTLSSPTSMMFKYNGSRSSFYQGETGPNTNSVFWTFNTTNSNTGNGVYSTPAIVNGKVYVGSGKAKVFCIDLNTGTQLWNYSTIPGSFAHGQSSSPAVANDNVFIGNDFMPQFWCINATTGVKNWNFSTGGAGMEGIYSSPATDANYVYIGTDSDEVFCLPQKDPNSDGSLKMSEIIWKFTAPDNVWSSPTVVNNRVYFGAGDTNSAGANKLYCLYANNGTLDWTYPSSGNIQDVLSTPAVVNGKVYFGATDNNIYALYANNGTFIWSYPTSADVISSPAVAYGKVFIGSDDNKLYCLDANTGSKIWDYTTGNAIWSSPSVADNKVYFGSCDGKVYCLNATSNSAQFFWEYYIYAGAYGICSSPAIADGKMVIGGVDPNLPQVYCFADVDLTPPTIIQTNPPDAAVDVPTTITVEINFSEPMDDQSVINSIIFEDSLSNPVGCNINYLDPTDSATLEPFNPLSRGETYNVTVKSSAKDKVGFTLDGNDNGIVEGSPIDDYTWQFTTSENIPPTLTSPDITPTEGDSNTDFEYRVIYTDLDNDTPEQPPGFIRVHIDGELVGRAMILDTSGALYLHDGNYSNGEQYVYTTKLSIYGDHTYQFKCSDGLDNVTSLIFDDPELWFPTQFNTISPRTAVEDIISVINLNEFLYDEDTVLTDLEVQEDSSYGEVDGLNISLLYPNSFNYPSGRNSEIVNISLYDAVKDYETFQDVLINVIPVNDAPLIVGVPDLQINEDEAYTINVSVFLSDEDNEIQDLAISTNSSYAKVTDRKITFSYPVNSGIKLEFVEISAFDGEDYGYQNITVTVISEGTPFVISIIPEQYAVEDTDLVLNMEEFVTPVGNLKVTDFFIEVSSSYGIVSGSNLIFNYPNAFNYPSGRTFEIVTVNVSHETYKESQGFIVNVEAVNDGPMLTVIEAPNTAIAQIPTGFRVKYFDPDGSEDPNVELVMKGTKHEMDFEIGNLHNEGGTFELILNLSKGEYIYYFQCDDMENRTNSVYTTNEFKITVINSTDADLDSDGDGIPDLWEIDNGLDPQDPSDAANDPDNDNYTNLQEYLGADGKPNDLDSTDPFDSTDFPEQKSDDKDESDTDDSAIYFGLVLGIIIIAIIIIVLFFILKKRKDDQDDEYLDDDDRPRPAHHGSRPPPPQLLAETVRSEPQYDRPQNPSEEEPSKVIEWDDEPEF